MKETGKLTAVHILIPRRGTCPKCYGKHGPNAGHDTASLAYINQYYRANRRFPPQERAGAPKK